jgi:peptide/nickel transport system substrate-binding protein
MRRAVLLAVVVALVAACDSSSSSRGASGGSFRLALPVLPRTIDPALARDLPALNVSHQLYAGLTRFSGNHVVPDLSDRWKTSVGGRVWTFHLRGGLRWSDGSPITSGQFKAAWIRALRPSTGAAYAHAEMLNIRGARAFRKGARASVVEIAAPDPRTLRVGLEHAVPWLDQQVAYPIFAPYRRGAFSGPFRLVSRDRRRIVLAKNASYRGAEHVSPTRVTLVTSQRAVDGVLPNELIGPGLPWIETGVGPARYWDKRGFKSLPSLTVEYLWIGVRRPRLRSAETRRALAAAIASVRSLRTFAPPGVLGYGGLKSAATRGAGRPPRLRLRLGYVIQDRAAPEWFHFLARFTDAGVRFTPLAVPTPARLRARLGEFDLALLGWPGEYFDAYNHYDLFTCTSGLTAGFCNRKFDQLMHRTVLTLDADNRRKLERRLERMLSGRHGSFPAIPLANENNAWVWFKPSLRGFAYSAIGFWDLRGLRRR